ncbi:uncharacterized protein N7483_003640 [Penicillium malachiteum]|uniref:uncharacterized protein n=1 Tax=Penicillium malachiteum TaxID=1324776 RepID=UPI002546D14B|nr:uncharacterized protein N7483_003640 [Penicillium malachiteum]KAJ5729132.1 hypothetical protein N7483_003640 [Penicillium malachiteum]
MVSVSNPVYYPSSPETPNWLDAMFGDKVLIDPRTFKVHNALGAPLVRFTEPKMLTRRNLKKLGRRSNCFPFYMWVENTIFMIQTNKYEPVPVDNIKNEDTELSDSDETTFEGEALTLSNSRPFLLTPSRVHRTLCLKLIYKPAIRVPLIRT